MELNSCRLTQAFEVGSLEHGREVLDQGGSRSGREATSPKLA